MLRIILHNARKVITGLLLSAGLGLFSDVQANHILGGEIGYTHLGANKYRFRVHVYRNCNECEFNSGGCADIRQLDILVSPEVSSTPNLLDQIRLTRISRREITPICATSATVCKGGNFRQGIEDWYYEGEYDFTLLITSHCKFEISMRVDSRLDAYSLGVSESYYNFARLNVCGGQTNSSPEFRSDAAYLLPYNQTFSYHMLADETEGDSLSFQLVSAQRGFNRNITYAGGYNGSNPADAFCPGGNCNWNRAAWPVQGIGMDPASGWMSFTPMKLNQTGFLVIQCTEWRKISGVWNAVGVSRRDMQFLVIDQQNYVPRLTTTADTFFACAGDEFALDVSVSDQIMGVRDTVRTGFHFALNKGRMGIAGGNGANQYDALWLFKPDSSEIRKKPYRLTLFGKDNHCPLNVGIYKDVLIYISPKPDAQFSLHHERCNLIRFRTRIAGSGETHAWFLSDQHGVLETLYGTDGQAEVPAPGWYRLVHQVVNRQTGCMTEWVDSINVPAFSLMTPDISWPANVCRGDSLQLTVRFSGGTAPFDYRWNGLPGGISRKFFMGDSQTMRVSVVDGDGCRLEFSRLVGLWPKVTLSTTDTTQCLPPPGQVIGLNRRYSIAPQGGNTTELFQLGGDGLLSRVGSRFTYQPYSSGLARFRVFHTDVNGCKYNDTFTVTVVKPPPTGISHPAPLCSNGVAADLNQATGCVLNGGKWNLTPPVAGFNGTTFNPVASGPGLFTAVFSVNFSGCVIFDTAEIRVNAAPVIKIQPAGTIYLCANASPVLVTASPSGGSWSHALGNANFITPVDMLRSGLDVLIMKYAYLDLVTGCRSRDSVRVQLSRLPEITGLPDTFMCASSSLLLNPVIKHAVRMGVTDITGPLTVRRIDDKLLYSSPELTSPLLARVKFLLTPLPGCQSVTTEQIIIVKPRPAVAIGATPVEACVPFTTNITLSRDGSRPLPDQTYWSTDPGVPGGLSKSLSVSIPGEREVSVIPVLQGCEGQEQRIRITGRETPVASFVINPVIRMATADFPYFTFRNSSQSADSLRLNWSFAGGKPAAGFLPKHDVSYPQDTGTYTVRLRVTTPYGCTDVFENKVFVMPRFRLWVPNVFTPDSKGPEANERWAVFIDSMAEFNLIIRNKWGEILFRSSDPRAAWDGNYLGKPAPSGMYAWHIEGRTIYGRYIDEKGTFALIR